MKKPQKPLWLFFAVYLFGLAACVAYVNQPPVAVINASPTSGEAPLTVNFNGSGSYDPDGEMVSISTMQARSTTSAAYVQGTKADQGERVG
jgi:PKD repeat protein